jgi:hypothetical protein
MEPDRQFELGAVLPEGAQTRIVGMHALIAGRILEGWIRGDHAPDYAHPLSDNSPMPRAPLR